MTVVRCSWIVCHQTIECGSLACIVNGETKVFSARTEQTNKITKEKKSLTQFIIRLYVCVYVVCVIVSMYILLDKCLTFSFPNNVWFDHCPTPTIKIKKKVFEDAVFWRLPWNHTHSGRVNCYGYGSGNERKSFSGKVIRNDDTYCWPKTNSSATSHEIVFFGVVAIPHISHRNLLLFLRYSLYRLSFK